MRYSLSTLENPSRVLFEFNRATTVSLGDVVLPVDVGLVTLNVRFFIVEDLTPYNAILGQSWLHKMKVISSTYHKMISYLTKTSQVYLHGSQLVTWKPISCSTVLPSNKRSRA